VRAIRVPKTIRVHREDEDEDSSEDEDEDEDRDVALANQQRRLGSI